jgi:hypothetical protein
MTLDELRQNWMTQSDLEWPRTAMEIIIDDSIWL